MGLWCFKPCGRSLPSGAWSSRTMQTWTSNRKPDGKVLVTWLLDVRGSREMLKNLNLKIPIVLILLFVTDASYKSPNLGPSIWLCSAPYYPLFLPQTPFCRLHLLFSPFPVIMHTKHEKAKQLTGKQHFIYSLLRHTTRQKFNTVFSSCPQVIISKIDMYLL